MLSKDTPEYEVSGGKDLDFERNPVAALQQVVGALVAPHPSTSLQPNPLTGIRDEIDKPARLSEPSPATSRFRETLETWRRSSPPRSGRLPKDPHSFADEAARCAGSAEWHCMRRPSVSDRAGQDRLSAPAIGSDEFYLGGPVRGDSQLERGAGTNGKP